MGPPLYMLYITDGNVAMSPISVHLHLSKLIQLYGEFFICKLYNIINVTKKFFKTINHHQLHNYVVKNNMVH